MIALLLLTFILSAALPAFAASWYRTGPGVTKTVGVKVTKNNPSAKGLIRLLTQDNSGKYWFRRGSKTGWAYVKGWYKVTVTQIRDYRNRYVNRRICTNSNWSNGSNYFNIYLAGGTYNVSVRLYGVVYSSSLTRQGWRPVKWHTYPCWKIG